MRSLFESLFTTKAIVRAKYPNGWVGWLKTKCLTMMTAGLLGSSQWMVGICI